MTPAVIIPVEAPSPEFDDAVRQAVPLAGHVFIAAHRGFAPNVAGATVVADPNDSGKGAAIMTAMSRASEMGFTHAVILDVDRQNSPAELPNFFDAIASHPEAIIVGVRQLPRTGATLRRRAIRNSGDLWNWLATGTWVHDTPHGYRAYPLAPVADLRLRCRRYEFDVEALVKAMWTGVKVVEIPVTPDTRFTTRHRPLPLVDVARFAWISTALAIEHLLLPPPLLASIHRKDFADLPLLRRIRLVINDAVRHHSQHPASFAACIGLGVFFGIAPVWGFQMILAATAAHLLGLSKRVVLAATYVSFPAMIPFILYASLLVGHRLYTGRFTGLPRPDQIERSVVLSYLGEYLAGSVVLAAAAAVAAALIAYVAAATVKTLRGPASC